MAATAEHAEEHAAQVHYEEYAQLLTSLPIEPQAHYQEDDIYHPANNTRI